MKRQIRRRIEREWNKIKVGEVCTEFIENNNLFFIPYTAVLQAIKLSDDLMCLYYIGIFGFKRGFGYLEHLVVCHFVNSVFKRLCLLEIGFVPEENLVFDDEFD